MSILKKLNSLNLPPETMVSLSFEEGCDVFVHNESEVETALSQTDVVATLASLLSSPGVKVYSNWGSELLEEMRIWLVLVCAGVLNFSILVS